MFSPTPRRAKLTDQILSVVNMFVDQVGYSREVAECLLDIPEFRQLLTEQPSRWLAHSGGRNRTTNLSLLV